jgi:hypothetical protein
MDYQESIYDMAPLIFAIMSQRVKNEVDSNYKYQYLYNSDEDDFMDNDKYMIYTLDGQHRLSTIYKYVETSNGNGFLKNKYIDFKFILINSVEEYNTIFFAVNNSLPQKIYVGDESDKFEVNLIGFVAGVNKYFAELYLKFRGIKANKMMISENENIKNPRPPCIHIEKIKGCNKLLDLLRKYGNDEIIKKMIKLNEEYSKKEITFFGHSRNYSSRDYDNVVEYRFYLGLHKNEPMKWIDDLE